MVAARVDRVTGEHAVVTGLAGLAGPLAVGDLVGVVPNHVCTAVNLGRELVVVSGGAVVDVWPVHSRDLGR